MYLTKTKYGYFIPSDDPSKEQANKLSIGDEVVAKSARNPLHHRKAFALLKTGFDNQEKYKSLEIYRKVMTILAGYYDEVPSKRGVEYIPHSISFENMSQQKFNEWYEATMQCVADDLGVTKQELETQLNEI